MQDFLNQYGDFCGMLHDLCPTHEMAPMPVEQGQSGQQPAEGPNDNAQNLNNMIDDVDKPLYDGYAKFSIFSAIVVLFQLKSFTMLLQLLKDLLPSDAKLPKDHYKAKKIIRNLGSGYEKIHAYPNDCVLFWKENVNLEVCPCYAASRWEMNEASIVGNNASSNKGKKKVVKILKWFPLKPRL